MSRSNVLWGTWLLVPVSHGIRAVPQDVELERRLMIRMEGRETAITFLAMEFHHGAHDGLHGVHSLEWCFPKTCTYFRLSDMDMLVWCDGAEKSTGRKVPVWDESTKVLLFVGRYVFRILGTRFLQHVPMRSVCPPAKV